MTKKFLVPIQLPADPVNPLEAATKQYVDSGAGGGISQAAADLRYLQLAGGTLTGVLNLPVAAPTADTHASNKKYVDDQNAVTLFSANGFTNTNFVHKTGDTVTGVLDINMPSGTTPAIFTTIAANANYLPFYQATTRRGYVGVFPADGTQFRLYADTGEVLIRAATAKDIIFHANAVEVGRVIDNSIVVGKATNLISNTGSYIATNGQVACTASTNIDNIICNATSAAVVTGHDFFSARNDNTVRGTIRATAGGVAFNVTSDYRKKNVLGEIPNATERLLQLKPVSFEWKEAPGSVDEGFLAHEVAEAVPYAVSGEKDGEKPQQLDYSKLTPLLTAVVQDLVGRVSALEQA